MSVEIRVYRQHLDGVWQHRSMMVNGEAEPDEPGELLQRRPATVTEQHFGHHLVFPFDVVYQRHFDEPFWDELGPLGPLSMVPPFPWGQREMGRELARTSGDAIELGVGLGGTSLFLAGRLQGTGRQLYACDTFAGLPEPGVHDNPYFLEGLYDGTTDLHERFLAHVAERGLTGVHTVRGPFSRTLPELALERIGLAHLDSDLYDSVHDSLTFVWDRMEPGGAVFVDDFFHPSQGVTRAVADFFNARGEVPLLHVVFPYSVMLRKGETGVRQARSVDGHHYRFDTLREDPVLRAAVSASVARGVPGGRGRMRAQALERLLDQPEQNGDIYDYLWAMSEFWESIAGGFTAPQQI